VLEQDFSRASQHDSFWGSFEDLIAEVTLQPSNLLRKWRLRDIEAGGGAAKAALFSDGDEVT
jgi:hypothetical protein